MSESAESTAEDLPSQPALPSAAPQPPRARSSHAPHLLHATSSLMSMIVIALFIVTFIAQPFRIPSPSMEPTLLVGDFLLVNKILHTPSAPQPAAGGALRSLEIGHGDVIVFRYPPDPRIHVVKRVIAIPGDRIRLKDGVVYLNGQPRHEPYAVTASSHPDSFRDQFPAAVYTDPQVDPRWWMQLRREVRNGEYIVPANSYFVLGDNRSNSNDSRYWGLVPRENIVGSPLLIYFSLRLPSTGDVSSLTDDKLDHQQDGPLTGFARWDRMFRVVR